MIFAPPVAMSGSAVEDEPGTFSHRPSQSLAANSLRIRSCQASIQPGRIRSGYPDFDVEAELTFHSKAGCICRFRFLNHLLLL